MAIINEIQFFAAHFGAAWTVFMLLSFVVGLCGLGLAAYFAVKIETPPWFEAEDR